MIREILFRGIRVDNHEWAEGYFHVNSMQQEYIISSDDVSHTVIPRTICEYSSFDDSCGNKIFECDILVDCKKSCAYIVFFKDGCFIAQQMGGDGESILLCDLLKHGEWIVDNNFWMIKESIEYL